MYLMVPKPLDSFNLLKVKGKVLKQKVLHASCEWYVSQVDASDGGALDKNYTFLDWNKPLWVCLNPEELQSETQSFSAS